MFSPDFYPTPASVIEMMLANEDINNKTILEPSAGKGNIVDYCISAGAANVIACEKSPDLVKILATKCKVIAEDFLTVTSDQVSHIDYIIMNPPFSADEQHILHAFDIAPAGCIIIALANLSTLKNAYSASRKTLLTTVENYGCFVDLGDCFSDAERKTGVSIALIRMQKPGAGYETEFEGFFMDDEPEIEGENGIMPYNVIRDLVNRYVSSVKLFDKQLELGVQMNALTSGFYSSILAFHCTDNGKPMQRAEFKKDMQKSGWKFIFDKLNMAKYATKGLREDINKFIETQTQIPFTMKNIYKMLEIIIGTQGQQMDKAILEVFDKLTTHYHENRYNVEGWKTNSHFLMGEKFILPNMCEVSKYDKQTSKINTNFGSYFELMEDALKAICYITGDNYDNFISLSNYINYPLKFVSGGKILGCAHRHSYSTESELKAWQVKYPDVEIKTMEPLYGESFDWAFFECRAFKKGTIHFKFKSQEVWGLFNQRVAKIKGYPLYENVKTQTNNAKKPEQKRTATPVQASILFTVNI